MAVAVAAVCGSEGGGEVNMAQETGKFDAGPAIREYNDSWKRGALAGIHRGASTTINRAATPLFSENREPPP